MKESQIRTEIKRLLERLGFWPITQTDAFKCENCGHVSRPPKGRPDTLLLHPEKLSIVCEYKMFGWPGKSGYASASLDTSKITEPQRVWLHTWNDRYAGWWGGSWLGLGTRHGRAGALYEPRRAWLVPWDKFCELETAFVDTTSLHSIPLLSYAGMKQGALIYRHMLWACNMFKPWELRWKQGSWWFKDDHPLYQAYGGYRELSVQKKRWTHWREVVKKEGKHANKVTHQ